LSESEKLRSVGDVSTLIPAPVLAALCGGVGVSAVGVHAQRISGGSGAATGDVVRIGGGLESVGAHPREFTIVSKTVRPLTAGRHAAHAHDPNHWAYWFREPLAYASAILPSGPGLRAPHCYAVVDSTIFMEDVSGPAEDPHVAAAHLGAWQARAEIPNLGWLTTDQLAQRVAVSDLDWSRLDADPRAVRLWEARGELLKRLSELPHVPSHGDFGVGNLLRRGDDTVALDWATVGIAPVGADLAYLALSTLTDLSTDYLSGLSCSHPASSALLGYRATLAVVGASRLHWMLAGGHQVPAGYVDFIWDAHPPF
jgi:hypothetical protein